MSKDAARPKSGVHEFGHVNFGDNWTYSLGARAFAPVKHEC